MKAGDQLSHAGLGEAFGTAGVGLLKAGEAVGEVAEFSLGFFVFGGSY